MDSGIRNSVRSKPDCVGVDDFPIWIWNATIKKVRWCLVLVWSVLVMGCASSRDGAGPNVSGFSPSIRPDVPVGRGTAKNGSGRGPASVDVDGSKAPSPDRPLPIPPGDERPRPAGEPVDRASAEPRPPSAPPPSLPAARELSTGKILVYYATNRRRSSSTDPSKVFTADPATQGDGMTYGTVPVSIPIDVHKRGVVEGTSILRLDLREDSARHVVMSLPQLKDKNDFYRQMGRDLSRRDSKDLLVFIHGFNNSFETAAKRLAVLKYDIGFRGIPVLFSWPSDTGLNLPQIYLHDTGQAEAAETRCRRFLKELVETAEGFGAKTVHIIAHSMGNRLLVDSLESLSARPDGKRWFGEVVMAAPDVDRTNFEQDHWPDMKGKAQRVSLYACNSDVALWVSDHGNGYPRIGQGGEGRLLLSGLDTIDVSSLGALSDTINHWHFGHNKVREDLRRLVIERLAPKDRALISSRLMDPRYWFFAGAGAGAN